MSCEEEEEVEEEAEVEEEEVLCLLLCLSGVCVLLFEYSVCLAVR